jgi:hypothetical protein
VSAVNKECAGRMGGSSTHSPEVIFERCICMEGAERRGIREGITVSEGWAERTGGSSTHSPVVNCECCTWRVC